ncbi:hypothetical protein [Photobacterium sanguinicancri]|uniref:hypothetical protein n=1 Tax=Photobacterium sanguinicancri TaxID=875932 RepID=UPI0026E12B58|nr:hypothetical protein [Photobacterium sanguinicancri]MDO6497321.1 hypothetical protein [Photobacterium sanguinicancri]
MAYEKRVINNLNEIIPFVREFLARNTEVPFQMARFSNATNTQWGVVHTTHHYMFCMDINILTHIGGQAWNLKGRWQQGSGWPNTFNGPYGYLPIPIPCEMYIIANAEQFVINFHNMSINKANILGAMTIAGVRDGSYWGAIASGPGSARYNRSYFLCVSPAFTYPHMLVYDSINNKYVKSGTELTTQKGILPIIRGHSRQPCLYEDFLHFALFNQSGTSLFMPCYMLGMGEPWHGELKGELPSIRALSTKYYGNGDIETYQSKRWLVFTVTPKNTEPQGFAFRIDD